MAVKGGSRFAVAMGQVFPDGCHLVPDSICEAMDYDEEPSAGPGGGQADQQASVPGPRS
jgi:hypothetical protein